MPRSQARGVLEFPRRLAGAVGRRIRRLLTQDPDRFLRRVAGVIHVGANTGQERELYERLGLNVAWIEPIPSVFAELQRNIAGYSRQKAFNCLLSDSDGELFDFKISNYEGQSSSIFDLAMHRDIWPLIDYVDTVQLRSRTLAAVVEEEGIDLARHDALVLDTQGSELLVLKGGAPLLSSFSYIKAEAADFEAYRDAPRLDDISDYLAAFGFVELQRTKFADHPDGGGCFNVVYRNAART